MSVAGKLFRRWLWNTLDTQHLRTLPLTTINLFGTSVSSLPLSQDGVAADKTSKRFDESEMWCAVHKHNNPLSSRDRFSLEISHRRRVIRCVLT